MNHPGSVPGKGIPRVESGREIAAARKANGLTQQELAQRAAVSLSLLRKIEQGSRSLSPEVSAALRTVLPGRTEDASAPDRITSALADVRSIMDAYDIVPEHSRALIPLQELRTLTSSAATRLRLASRYTQLAGLPPGLDAWFGARVEAWRDRLPEVLERLVSRGTSFLTV